LFILGPFFSTFIRRRVATCEARVDAAEARGEARYVTSRVGAVVGSFRGGQGQVEVVCRLLAFTFALSRSSVDV